jgi:acyl CoA:acetate/3-ketoacid CoA transferase beta subunit
VDIKKIVQLILTRTKMFSRVITNLATFETDITEVNHHDIQNTELTSIEKVSENCYK